MFDNVFLQIGVIVGLASLGGLLTLYLKQPLIVAFIALGILLGPSGVAWVEASSEIELFARLGIALLLFVVGLKLDIHVIRTVGPVALASGLGQVLFTSVIGFLIALGLGMSTTSAIYVALALTFSSTIIIVKILSDKREVNTLHGRIAVGFLIVQDIVVVLVMIGLMAFGQSSEVSLKQEAMNVLWKGVLMLGSVALLMRYLLPYVLRHMARSSELLVLFAIGWAVLGACAGHELGFSKEVGAFLAGISIASTPYREQIAARLVSLRDFLLLFFFIELGSALDMSVLSAQVGRALIFSLFVLLGNPLIVMTIMGIMGYRRRTGFLAGLTVAQISEFSLILAALGFSLGHISEDIVGLITLVGLITISVSTYMILYSQSLYERLSPYLRWFEKNIAHKEISDDDEPESFDVIVIGYGRFGAVLADNLQQHGKRVLAIDYDPDVVKRHSRDGCVIYYGDIEDAELINNIPMDSVESVISTIRDRTLNKALLHNLKLMEYQGNIVVCVDNARDEERFTRYGSDYVLSPYANAAHQATENILALNDRNKTSR